VHNIDRSEAGLERRVRNVYDHLYANSQFKTPARILGELGKVLHVALFLEEHDGIVPAFQHARASADGLQAADTEILERTGRAVRLKFREMNSAWRLYGRGAQIDLSDYDISYACLQLSGVQFSSSERDAFGDTVEIIRSEWAKRAGGQFFTDQHVTSLAMELLQFDPRAGDDLIDICAGTGGFLLAGLDHIRRLLVVGPVAAETTENAFTKLAVESVRGQEIDDEVCSIANASLAARLGLAGRDLVSRGDSLAPGAFAPGRKDGMQLARHRCAASNPPFGSRITVKDPRVLSQFVLAQRSGKQAALAGLEEVAPRSLDVLFLERNLQMLEPGKGRLAIVLPYQLLSGPDTLYVRTWLLRNAVLQAVIDLPAETFQPHTGTKTALLVVRKRETPLTSLGEREDGRVFMASPRWIGHDRRGNPMYRTAADGKETGVLLADFDEVSRAFRSFIVGKDPGDTYEYCFGVPLKSIVRDRLLRMNALYHSPRLAGATRRTRALVRSGWRTAKLRELTSRIFYPGRFKRHYVDHFPGAVPFLGGANITELTPVIDKWLMPDGPKMEELRVRTGWILVTRSGSTGIVSSVPPAWDGFAMSEHVIRVVPAVGGVAPEYLLAFLRSRHGQEQLARGVFGSVIDEISVEHVGDIDVPLPDNGGLIARVETLVRKAEQTRQDSIAAIAEATELIDDEVYCDR